MSHYERFAPLAPPNERRMQRAGNEVKAISRWQLRLGHVIHDDQSALELARNRHIIVSFAAITAGVGFLLGTLVASALWATRARAPPRTPNQEQDPEPTPPRRKRRTGAKQEDAS